MATLGSSSGVTGQGCCARAPSEAHACLLPHPHSFPRKMLISKMRNGPMETPQAILGHSSQNRGCAAVGSREAENVISCTWVHPGVPRCSGGAARNPLREFWQNFQCLHRERFCPGHHGGLWGEVISSLFQRQWGSVSGIWGLDGAGSPELITGGDFGGGGAVVPPWSQLSLSCHT